MYLNAPVADAAAPAASGGFPIPQEILFFGIMIAALYFFMIRPQKKREKEAASMRSSIAMGDEIITIGGIYGKVVRIKDDTLFIESSADKTKIQISKWAVKDVTKKTEEESKEDE